MRTSNQFQARRDEPIEHRGVLIVGERVVRIQTQHLSESIWIAKGEVSERLPTGPFLRRPAAVTATGRTESEAVEALKQRIRELRINGG